MQRSISQTRLDLYCFATGMEIHTLKSFLSKQSAPRSRGRNFQIFFILYNTFQPWPKEPVFYVNMTSRTVLSYIRKLREGLQIGALGGCS